MMDRKRTYYCELIIVSLVFLLTSCTGEIQETDAPVETPGAIEKLAPGNSFKLMTVIDWRFDPDRILILKGVSGEFGNTPHDLVWLDLKSNQFIPIQVPENGEAINCPAQGKNGQVVYGREFLYLYDSRTGVKTTIGKGCFSIFSPTGTKVAFKVAFQGDEIWKIYDIPSGQIEQSIPLLPIAGEVGKIETGKIGWRNDEQAMYVVYSWFDEQHVRVRSQIREIELSGLNQRVIYEGAEIDDFSLSPDGRLISLVETDHTNKQTILKIIQIENLCEINKRVFPPYSLFIRWSPTGESILMDFSLALNPYLINVKEVFGETYDKLKCK